jgi:DNA-binding IclR family transcriptional regulator
MTAQLKSVIQTGGSQANQSIIDGIAVLQALATAEEPVGSRELARRLGLENTRVNRLLKTLASIGMAEQNAVRKYRPGPGMHVLAAQSLYASGLLRNALVTLEKLAYFKLTVALGVLWQNSVSFLYHARPGMSASEGIGRMGLRDATTSGIGMVLLAMQPEEQVVRIYEGKDIPGYPKGLKSLLRELAAIRKKGYARVEVFPENAVRTPSHSIAVPVGNPVNSAIALSGWIPESSVDELVEALQQARQEIEASFSHQKSSRRSA